MLVCPGLSQLTPVEPIRRGLECLLTVTVSAPDLVLYFITSGRLLPGTGPRPLIPSIYFHCKAATATEALGGGGGGRKTPASSRGAEGPAAGTVAFRNRWPQSTHSGRTLLCFVVLCCSAGTALAFDAFSCSSRGRSAMMQNPGATQLGVSWQENADFQLGETRHWVY